MKKQRKERPYALLGDAPVLEAGRNDHLEVENPATVLSSAAIETANPLTIAFADLDYFGQVNKEFGWPTGDEVLKEVCDTIRQHMRKTDWIGRYGSEEFCLVMPGTAMEVAAKVLKRIREAIEFHDFQSVDGEPVPMTISIGAAAAVPGDSDYLELLARASSQALKAKQNGRNQLII